MKNKLRSRKILLFYIFLFQSFYSVACNDTIINFLLFRNEQVIKHITKESIIISFDNDAYKDTFDIEYYLGCLKIPKSVLEFSKCPENKIYLSFTLSNLKASSEYKIKINRYFFYPNPIKVGDYYFNNIPVGYNIYSIYDMDIMKYKYIFKWNTNDEYVVEYNNSGIIHIKPKRQRFLFWKISLSGNVPLPYW